jgi:amino acid transporter
VFGVKAPSTLAVTAVGVVWIAIMTAVCVIGVEVNARTQRWLLAAEIVTLAAFAVVALVRVGLGDGALTPELSWFSPFAVGSVGALTSGLLVAVFIYWGWDSLVCVNEETEDAETVPGRIPVWRSWRRSPRPQPRCGTPRRPSRWACAAGPPPCRGWSGRRPCNGGP